LVDSIDRGRPKLQVRAELAAKRVQLQGLLQLKEAAVFRDGDGYGNGWGIEE